MMNKYGMNYTRTMNNERKFELETDFQKKRITYISHLAQFNEGSSIVKISMNNIQLKEPRHFHYIILKQELFTYYYYNLLFNVIFGVNFHTCTKLGKLISLNR